MNNCCHCMLPNIDTNACLTCQNNHDYGGITFYKYEGITKEDPYFKLLAENEKLKIEIDNLIRQNEALLRRLYDTTDDGK